VVQLGSEGSSPGQGGDTTCIRGPLKTQKETEETGR
jgi:hypothetical protein